MLHAAPPAPYSSIADFSRRRSGPGVRDEGAWRVHPVEGVFDIAYRRADGVSSSRRVIARDVKLGPGRTLLCGTDPALEDYRGFRADRIERLVDVETGETLERDIVDWLIRRATRKRRGRAA